MSERRNRHQGDHTGSGNSPAPHTVTIRSGETPPLNIRVYKPSPHPSRQIAGDDPERNGNPRLDSTTDLNSEELESKLLSKTTDSGQGSGTKNQSSDPEESRTGGQAYKSLIPAGDSKSGSSPDNEKTESKNQNKSKPTGQRDSNATKTESPYSLTLFTAFFSARSSKGKDKAAKKREKSLEAVLTNEDMALSRECSHLWEKMIRMPHDLECTPLYDAYETKGGLKSFGSAVRVLMEEFGVVVKQLRRIDGERAKWEKKYEDLKKEHEKKMEEHETDRYNTGILLSKMEADKNSDWKYFDVEFKRQERHYLGLIEAKITKHGEEIAGLNQEKARLIREHDDRLKEQQADHEAEIAKIQDDFDSHRDQMKRDFSRKQERLKNDVKALNSALVARNTNPGLTDNDMKSKFTELAQDIDGLCRREWEINRTDWDLKTLSKLKQNQRKVKLSILKQTMWSVLCESMFSSPFRVLGPTVGSDLEEQWAREFGAIVSNSTAYNWPKPTIKSERWRIENIREAREATELSLTEFDKRYKLKHGFEEAIKLVEDDLSTVLEEVGPITNLDKRAIKKIARKAADMWIDFSNQNYRVMIVYDSTFTVSSFMKQLSQGRGSLDLIIVPELKRIGSSSGEDLDLEDVIRGVEREALSMA